MKSRPPPPVSQPTPKLPLGDPLIDDPPAGRYEPERLLGRGAAGAVYRCRDTVLDRIVALKLFNGELSAAGGSSGEEDALTEARALANVEHPNLIRIHDLGVHRGQPFMVVEHIDGPNLLELLASERRLPAWSVASSGMQLAKGLMKLHEAGYVHQDVKPSNGLVDSTGRVRLADFGLVQQLAELSGPRDIVRGTPDYMAPEMALGNPIGHAADIYELGATLFHLAAGRQPFVGGDPLRAHVLTPAPDLQDFIRAAPPALAALLQRMMAKDPEDRPSLEEVVETLQPVALTAPKITGSSYLPREPDTGGSGSQSPLKLVLTSDGLGAVIARPETRNIVIGGRRPGLVPGWLKVSIVVALVMFGATAIWAFGGDQLPWRSGEAVVANGVEHVVVPAPEASAAVAVDAVPTLLPPEGTASGASGAGGVGGAATSAAATSTTRAGHTDRPRPPGTASSTAARGGPTTRTEETTTTRTATTTTTRARATEAGPGPGASDAPSGLSAERAVNRDEAERFGADAGEGARDQSTSEPAAEPAPPAHSPHAAAEASPAATSEPAADAASGDTSHGDGDGDGDGDEVEDGDDHGANKHGKRKRGKKVAPPVSF